MSYNSDFTKKMSSKMRRTPLFGFDGNLGIPIIPSKSKQPSTSNSTSSSSNSQQKSSSSGKQKSNTKFGSYSVPHTDYSNSKVGLGSEMIIVIPFYLSFQTPTCKIHRHCIGIRPICTVVSNIMYRGTAK